MSKTLRRAVSGDTSRLTTVTDINNRHFPGKKVWTPVSEIETFEMIMLATEMRNSFHFFSTEVSFECILH